MSRFAPTPIAKIARPSLQGIVARPRLFAALASAVPVAWVTAAPGAGKTALAVSYCASSKGRGLWYRIDGGDSDPATFFHFMRRLAAPTAPLGDARLPGLPPESGVDLAVFARQFFRAFFATLPVPSTWVIDNFQDAVDPSLALILREAFQQIPEGVAVIVLSHVDPPPLLARLTANGLVRRLGTDELRLTRAESDDVVRAALAAEPKLLSELHKKSSGWAAGLVLMIDYLRRAGGCAVPSVEESQAAVFDYFAAEIFAACSSADQRTLMLTAMLPRVTTRLAAAMSGRSDAGELLERLHRRHLFLDRQPVLEPSYEYHRLFKLFLAGRANAILSPQERADAANRAAGLLGVDGQPEDAIHVYLAAGNDEAAARLIVQEAPRLHSEGRWRTLLDWIVLLPPSLFTEHPWLAYWAGACRVWSDPAIARHDLEGAFRGFAAAGDARGQVLAAGALTRACILGTLWTRLDEWIDALETLLPEDAPGLEPEVVLTGLSRLVYAALARRPQHPRLASWAKRAHALLDEPAAPDVAVLAGYSLLFYFTWTGQAVEGEQVVRRIVPLTNDSRLSSVSHVHWLFAQANHVLRFGAPGSAMTLMDRALQLASGAGLTIEGVIRRHRIVHVLTLDRLGEAETELEKLAQAPPVEPYFELRAWLAWRQGRTAVGMDEARAALRLATERGRTFYRVLDLALVAVMAATVGDADEALAHLAAYRTATAGTPGEYATFQALLIEAYVEHSRGAHEACRSLLRRALEIGCRQRYQSWWAWSPTMMTPLLEDALRHGIALEYCRTLIRTHRLAPATPDAEHWPWPVRIRTLGRFEVELDGAVMRFEGKTQRKPLTMLKILVAAGDRSVSIEELIERLWPNPEDGGRKAFDITVHRLRKLIACEEAVVVADRHASLDARFVWVDAWAFERLLEPFLPLAGPPACADRLEAAVPRALDLFGGQFLPDEPDMPWVLVPRHRLASRMQRCAALLGTHREAAGQWQSAGELYQRMIELDPLAESFYRRQMICLRAQARRAEALEVFRRCRHMLATRLGIAPDRDTEQVYQELVAS